MGFPGKPKNNFSFLLNLANIIGRPGFIETPLKYVLKLSSFSSFGIKSNLPADIAPEVTNISISDLSDFLSFSLSFLCSLSFITPPSIIW